MKLTVATPPTVPDTFHAELSVRPTPDDSADAVAAWRSEIDGFYAAMGGDFQVQDPGTVFMQLAAFSARMSEVRTIIARHDNRRWQSFRKAELEPFLEECERQYRYHSRALSVREQEMRLAGGGV